MVKFLILCFLSILLGACQKFDEHYFRSNPQVLQKVLKDCSQREMVQVDCSKIEQIAHDVNSLAYDLQINPQAFGIKILLLQNELAKQQAELCKKPGQEKIKERIKDLQQQLTLRLALVKWLESPEG